MDVTLSLLHDRLQNVESTLNIYQWGSRVYGCARPDSDWDFVIVTKDIDSNLIEPTPRNLLNDIDKTYPVIEDDLINVTFIPLSHFISLVREHRHEALECVFLPDRFVWQHQAEIPVEIDVDILRKTVSWEAARRFQTAKNRIKNGEIMRGKKELVHACRYLLFASQIAKEGNIYDYGAGNSILENILQDNSDCEVLFAKYHEILYKLKEDFKLYTVFHKFYGRIETERSSLQLYKKQYTRENKTKVTALIRNIPQNTVQINYNDVPILAIIKSKALELHSIERHYGLLARPHSQYPHLMLFTFIGHSKDMNVSKDCKGLIVDLNTGEPVCIPVPIIPHYTSSIEFNWQSAIAYEYIDGVSANMYWYSGQWHLASAWEPNDPQAPMNFKDEKDTITFSILFWDLWNLRKYQFPVNKDLCYNFVLGTKRHRYVVRYPEDDIYLVGVRDLKTRKSMSIEQVAVENSWKIPYRVENASLAILQQSLANKNPFVVGGRGYVVQDNMHRLVKVGSKQFISVSYGTDFSGSGGFNLNCEMDERQMVELIRADKLDTFLLYHPQWKTFANKMLDLYNTLESQIQNTFDDLVVESGNKRKEFAELVKKNKCSVTVYALCEDYSSAHQFLTLIEEKQFWKLWREIVK